MKRLTLLIFIPLSLVLIFVFIGFQLWPTLHVDDRLRQLVLKKAREQWDGEITLERVHLTFSALALYQVSIRDKQDRFSLTLDKVAVSLNLFEFITHGFSLASAFRDLSVDHPQIVYRFSPTDTSQPATTSDSLHLNWALLDQVPEILWGKSLKVASGDLQVLSSEGRTLLLLNHLDVQFDARQRGFLEGKLTSGIPGSSSPECDLYFTIDQRAQTLQSGLQVKLKFIHFGRDFGIPQPITLALDSLDVKLYLWISGEKDNLNGEIAMKRLTVENGQGPILYTDPFLVSIENWNVRLRQIQAHGLSADWELQGEIKNLKDPSLEFQIGCQSEDISGIKDWVPVRWQVQPVGAFSLNAEVKGKWNQPEVIIQANLERLNTPVETVQHLEINADWAEKRLMVNHFTLTTPEGRLTGQGQALLDSAFYSAEGEYLWEGQLPKLKMSRTGILDGDFSFARDLYRLHSTWTPDSTQYGSLNLTATYRPSVDLFEADIANLDLPGAVRLTLHQALHDPLYDLQVTDPQYIVESGIANPIRDKTKDLHLKGEFHGTLKQTACNLQVEAPLLAARIRLIGTLESTNLDKGRFRGQVSGQKDDFSPITGSIDLSWKEAVLTLTSLKLDDAISIRGSLDLRKQEWGNTTVSIEDWPLERGLQFLSPELAVKWGGDMRARLDLYGPLKQPVADFTLYLYGCHYQEKENFWAVMRSNLENGRLNVESCQLGRGIKLLEFSGSADLPTTALQFRVQSDLHDAAEVLDLFGGNPLELQGPLRLVASVGGTWKKPELQIEARMNDGRLYHVPFLSLACTVSLDSSTQGALTVKEFQIYQSPELKFTAAGTLPYNGHPLNLKGSLQGDFLKYLHDIEPDILESRGFGEVQIEVGEKNGQIRLLDAQLQLHDGYLRLPDVVQEIRAITAAAEFKGGRLLLQRLSGRIENTEFVISNSFDSSAATAGLQHLYFSALDVDLGYLRMSTSNSGIRCHLPALTLGEVKSLVNLKGQNGEEDLIIAGPVERPVFRGTVTISNADINFPFPPSHGQPPKFVQAVLNVLSSAQWDLVILPGKNNRYVREIVIDTKKTFLGGLTDFLTTVQMNLTIDLVESHLKVLGSLNEGTFHLLGDLVATQGSIEYLDFNFRVERFEAEFDRNDILPWVSGKASTVYMDSMGISRTIYATLYVVDPVTEERHLRGRWGDFIFMLEDDLGSSQEQILAAMGYSPGTVTEKMYTLGGSLISTAVARSFIRPVERKLEDVLNIDIIRLQPTIAQNLYQSQILGIDPGPGPGPQNQLVWGGYLLRQSQITVGKYLSDDLLMYYTGVWKTGLNAQNERHFGFLNRWNIDYRIRPVSGNMILSLVYEYDSLEKLDDKQISLRYSFVF